MTQSTVTDDTPTEQGVFLDGQETAVQREKGTPSPSTRSLLHSPEMSRETDMSQVGVNPF